VKCKYLVGSMCTFGSDPETPEDWDPCKKYYEGKDCEYAES